MTKEPRNPNEPPKITEKLIETKREGLIVQQKSIEGQLEKQYSLMHNLLDDLARSEKTLKVEDQEASTDNARTKEVLRSLQEQIKIGEDQVKQVKISVTRTTSELIALQVVKKDMPGRIESLQKLIIELSKQQKITDNPRTEKLRGEIDQILAGSRQEMSRVEEVATNSNIQGYDEYIGFKMPGLYSLLKESQEDYDKLTAASQKSGERAA